MKQDIVVTGMILLATSVGEYDKRLVILTRERGKITAFAKGARRQNSTLLAKSNPFSFGTFTLIAGRNTYHVRSAKISNYFREMALDYERVCYGFYFLEFAEYYTRESNDEFEMLKLLYQSMKALLTESIPMALVRYIFELKAMVINGEYPGLFFCNVCGSELKNGYFSVLESGVSCEECHKAVSEGIYLDETTLYTLQYVVSSSIEKLYTFVVNEDVFKKIKKVMNLYKSHHIDKHFKTLDVLDEDFS